MWGTGSGEYDPKSVLALVLGQDALYLDLSARRHRHPSIAMALA